MKLMAIDGNSIVNRAFYGIRHLSASDGTPTNAIYGFLTILNKLLGSEKPDALCVTFDLPAPTFRHERYSGYKAQRKGMPDDLAVQMPILKEILDAMNIPRIELAGWEADDLLGTISDICRAKNCQCIIVTGDKDALQLVSDTTIVKHVKTRGAQTEWNDYTPDVFTKEYGFPPHMLIDLKALMGDSSDNIPGIPGVGEKTAMDLVRRFGSIEEIYRNLETLDIKDSLRAKISAGHSNALLSFDLAQIRTNAPIAFSPEDNLRREPDNDKLYTLFTHLRLMSFIDKYNLRPLRQGDKCERGTCPRVHGSKREQGDRSRVHAPAQAQTPTQAPAPLTITTPEQARRLLEQARAAEYICLQTGISRRSKQRPCTFTDNQTPNDNSLDTVTILIPATDNETDNETDNATVSATVSETDNATVNAINSETVNETDNKTNNATVNAINSETVNETDNKINNATVNAINSETVNETDNKTNNLKQETLTYTVNKTKTPGFDTVLKTIFSEEIKKVAHNVKDIIRACLEQGIPAGGWIFDTALAAYLVSPTESNYDLSKISGYYCAYIPLRRQQENVQLSLLDMFDAPDSSDAPNNPDVTGAPNAPDNPNAPDSPDAPDAPNAPDSPDAPNNPDVTGAPNTPDTLDAPNTPDSPNTPDAPDNPNIPDTLDAPKKPDAPDNSNAPKKPDAPDTSDSQKNPNTPENKNTAVTIETEQASDVFAISLLYTTLSQKLNDLNLEKLYYSIELPLCPILAQMEHTGFLIDKQALIAFSAQLEESITKTEKQIYEHAGGQFNINSPKQLGVILFEKLMLPPPKKTKTGYSTNVEVLDSLLGRHPIISLLKDYRELTKLKSTYAEGLLRVIAPDGRIHTHFQMTATATGRLSSTEPNLQNIPIRKATGGELRKMFIASEGNILVGADYSQIELRILAHISADSVMINAFKNGEDIHTVTASQVFDIHAENITATHRTRAKAVNFGIVYGISAFSLANDIDVTPGEAKAYIDSYLAKYSGVRSYMENVIKTAKEQGYVSTLYGRRREMPELKSSNFNTRAFGERVARNMPIQGTAADIMKIAMINAGRAIKAAGLKARLIMQVHDELIVECPIEEAETVSGILRRQMESATQLDIPLLAETHIGKSWYDTK